MNRARVRADPLISEGVFSCALASLSSVGAHYDDVNFEAVGLGYPQYRSDAEIDAVTVAVMPSAQALSV
jgi:hypothetical protein